MQRQLYTGLSAAIDIDLGSSVSSPSPCIDKDFRAQRTAYILGLILPFLRMIAHG
jgi:hypothetical protein